MKEGMDSVENFKYDNDPVLLIEEGKDTIWTRCFVETQLKHSELYFFIVDKAIEGREFMHRQLRYGQGSNLFKNLLKASKNRFLIRVLKTLN